SDCLPGWLPEQVLERIARFDRVLSVPGGSLLLAGPSGAGRRSCALLLAYMHHLELFTPKMTRNYDLKSFRNDMKEVLKKAGVEGKAVMLLLEDYQIVEPSFLEMVNSVLSGGEVPGLFSPEELAKELGPLEAVRDSDAAYTGPQNTYAYFTYRQGRVAEAGRRGGDLALVSPGHPVPRIHVILSDVSVHPAPALDMPPLPLPAATVVRNLHVVVSMDPANELFRARCESNPALLTGCALQWLEAWGPQGSAHIPRVRLQQVMAAEAGPQANGSPKEKKGKKKASSMVGVVEPLLVLPDRAVLVPEEELVQHMVWLHQSMIPLGASPRQFIALVDLYGRIYAAKRTEVLAQQNFLKGGLSKLADAEGTVDGLNRTAQEQRKVLKVKQAEADEALVRIQASMMQAADRRQEVERLKKKQAVEEVEMQNRRGGVENELAEVQPLIDQARKAVGQIKKENIDEIRSLKMPPDAIRDVLEGVLLVLGQDDTSWNNMKKFLGAKAVKDEIVNYDANKITPEMRAKVNKLLSVKGNSFEHAVIHRVSVAASPLAAWVKANVQYSKVLERVAPLQSELQGLVDSLKQSAALIVQYEAELVECDTAVAALKTDFAKRTSEAETLRVSVEKADGILQSARNLLDKLSGEKGRWVKQVGTLEEELVSAPMAALLTSAFITYLPSKPEDVRSSMQQHWGSHLALPDYSFTRFMSSESQMLQWKAEGLPADTLSMQNAVVILNSAPLAPLIIDPSTQASEWLAAHLRIDTPSLEVTTLHEPRFANTLELAVRFGKTLIVGEVDRLEPLLVPLLRRDLERQGPRFVVALGDKMVDYNDTFRLYLVTRNPDPYLPPDVRSLVAVTNFTVTRSGLEGQLLGLTLQREQPELEEKKSGLLRQEEELKVQLAELERSLLQTLATSTGNLLDNKELLDSLTAAKTKSATIASSLETSRELQASLDSQREVYRPVAQRGSSMYFLMRDLSALNHMYQFSLGVFLALFRRALDQDAGSGGNVTARIAVLSDALIELVFGYVSRSLFNADRLTFAMHMARHLLPAGAIKPEEWLFYLGKPSVDASAGGAAARPSWVRDEMAAAWSLLAANFPKLMSGADLSDGAMWGSWVSGNAAGSDGGAGTDGFALPQRIANKVSPFQTLLLVQAFRPDKLQSAMTAFACSSLNVKGVSPPSTSLRALIEAESSATQPILLLTTPGADPCAELAEYAATVVGRERYHEIAMGQGQAERALTLLRDAARSGDWLCLKNLHLAVSWLGVLEKECYTLQKNAGFRLFLTSEPHPRFPATLLEASLKVTFEAPPGLKKNLQRTYEGWDTEWVAAGSPLRAQLLFVLAWFHAVVQERRTYIPQASQTDRGSSSSYTAAAAAAAAAAAVAPGITDCRYYYLQGWSKFYEFSTADLRSGADVIGLATRAASAGKGAAAGSVQWSLLHGLLENAIYGGRVDNVFDVKVLRTYLRQYFNPQVVGAGGGKVRPLPGCRAVVPSSTHRQDYVQVVSALSETDVPALFSLPANIGRAAQQGYSERVVASLKAMSVSRNAAAGFNRTEWQAALGPLLRLWDTLMASAAPLKAAAKDLRKAGTRKEADTTSPVDSFVALERAAAVALVEAVNSTLAGVGRVLRGQDTINPRVQKEGGALLADTVPGSWDALWEGPASPTDFVRAVVSRALAIEQWWSKCVSGSLLSSGPLDLAHLLRPGTFLNALRQQTARAAKMPLDELKLATCWSADHLPKGSVQDAPTSKIIPPMTLAWLPKSAALPYTNFIPTPLYATHDRAKVLAEVQLPLAPGADEDAAALTLAGLALFLAA
ncbi:hypothetical protein QJQ45_029247, partial [Haematococcus lacustris]